MSSANYYLAGVERLIVIIAVVAGMTFYSTKIFKLKSRLASAEKHQSSEIESLNREFKSMQALMYEIQSKLK